jgi:uncharacterized phiE125 gp8 family phage protein
MPEVLVTPPEDSPVALAEVKLHLRVTHDAEDSEIQSAIDDAVEYLEDRLGQQFITAEWLYTLPCFPSGCIMLPRPPVQTVDEITYVDLAGTTQTLDAAEYQVDIYSKPARIMPAYGKFWPIVRSETFNAVQVSYTAGYGDTADDMPRAVGRAIKFLVSWWYHVREPYGSISGRHEATLDSLLASLWHGEYSGARQ